MKINAKGVADNLLAIADGVTLAGGAEKMIRLAADGLRHQEAEIERLRAEVERARTVEDLWRAECLKAQQMLVEERARVADVEPTEPLDHCGACGQWLGWPVSCCYKSHDFPPVTATQAAKIREGKE